MTLFLQQELCRNPASSIGRAGGVGTGKRRRNSARSRAPRRCWCWSHVLARAHRLARRPRPQFFPGRGEEGYKVPFTKVVYIEVQ